MDFKLNYAPFLNTFRILTRVNGILESNFVKDIAANHKWLLLENIFKSQVKSLY